MVDLHSTPSASKVQANIWVIYGAKGLLKFQDQKTVDGTKPTFTWRDYEYTIDLEKVRKFNKDGIPILDFEKDHAKPIQLGLAVADLPTNDNSHAFKRVIKDGILASVLASATRVKADVDWKVYLLAGVGLGFIVAVILAHFGFLGGLVSSVPTTTGGVTSG